MNRIERKLERANRHVGKLENSLQQAVARRKAEHERRRAALDERHARTRAAMEERLERERGKLDKAFATCEPRRPPMVATALGTTTAWATASEWLALYKRTRGKRITTKNRAALEAMIVKLGQAPEVLEEARNRTLDAIAGAIRYFQGEQADALTRTRRQLNDLRKARKGGKKRTVAPRSAAPVPKTQPEGDLIIIPPRLYDDILAEVRTMDVEVVEPGRIAWGRAIEGAKHTANRYHVTLPANRSARLAAIDSLEELERQRSTSGSGRAMSLRAIGRLLTELRGLAGVNGPATTSPAPAPAPRTGRVPGIRWKAGRARPEPGGGRRRETRGKVPGTRIEFTITLTRAKGRPLSEQEVSIAGTYDGRDIEGLPRDHRTMPEAKRAARAWLAAWWKREEPTNDAPSSPEPAPPLIASPPTPAPRKRATRKPSQRAAKSSTPTRVVASALAMPGDGEFIATVPASKLIDAVEAALKLTGKKREDRRSLGLLSVEDGRVFVTSRRLGGTEGGVARLDCEVVGSSGGARASIVLSLPELLAALKPLANLDLRLRIDTTAVTLVLEHDRGHMVMPFVREERFENRFTGEALREYASVDLPHDVLAQAFESVFYAASRDEARLNLHGVYIEPDDKETVIAATDGHRLALVRFTATVASTAGSVHYDDVKALLWLAKGAKQTAARWSMYTDDVRHVYRWSGVRKGMPWTLTAETTSWTFPPYRQVVPDPAGAKDLCTVRRVELLRALKIAGADLDATTFMVRLLVRADGLTIESENVGQGTRNRVTVPDWSCSLSSAAERLVALNWRYVAEALEKGVAQEFEQARVALFEDLAPVVLRFERALDEVGVRELVALVMPMRAS